MSLIRPIERMGLEIYVRQRHRRSHNLWLVGNLAVSNLRLGELEGPVRVNQRSHHDRQLLGRNKPAEETASPNLLPRL